MYTILKNKVFKDTLIYTLTDGISKALSFLMLPFVSFYLVPEQLGIAANFDVLQQILLLLAGQAIVNGLPYFYYERSKGDMAKLVSNLLFIIVSLSLLFSVILFFIYGMLEEYLHLSLALQLLSVVSVFACLVVNIDMVLLRLEERPKSFAAFQICQSLLFLFLLFVFVVVERMEALGKIYCGVVAFSVMGIVHFGYLLSRKYICLTFDRNPVRELCRFGIPLLPHSLSFWLKTGMDKILLTTFCGLAVNGLYSMAVSFGAVFSLFTTAFNNAFVPYLQKRLSRMTPATEQAEKRRIVLLSYKISGGFVLLYLVSLVVCYLAFRFALDAKYAPAFQFIPWILLAQLINAFYSLVIQYPYTVKKTLGLGAVTFSGSILQLTLTYTLIRCCGADGIKVSLVAGALLILTGVWWYSNKVYPMPWFSVSRSAKTQ